MDINNIFFDSLPKNIQSLNEELAGIQSEIEFTEKSLGIKGNPSFLEATETPSNRFLLNEWEFFDAEFQYNCPGEIAKCEFSGEIRDEVDSILNYIVEKHEYDPKLFHLRYGYHRKEPSGRMNISFINLKG